MAKSSTKRKAAPPNLPTSRTKKIKNDSVTTKTIDTVPRLPSTRARSAPRAADESVSYAEHARRTRPVAAPMAELEEQSLVEPHGVMSSISESGRSRAIGAGTGANNLSDFVKAYLKAASSEPGNVNTGCSLSETAPGDTSTTPLKIARTSVETGTTESFDRKLDPGTPTSQIMEAIVVDDPPSTRLVMINTVVDASHRITDYADTVVADRNPTLAALLEPILAEKSSLTELILDTISARPYEKYIVGSSSSPTLCRDNFMQPSTFRVLGPLVPGRLSSGPGSRVPSFPCPKTILDELGISHAMDMLTISIFPEHLTAQLLDLPPSHHGLVNLEIFQALPPPDATAPSGQSDDTQMLSAVSSPSPSVIASPPSSQGPLPTTVASLTLPQQWLQSLMRQTFGSKIDTFTLLFASSGYETAYLAHLEDRLLSEICQVLFAPRRTSGLVDFDGVEYKVTLKDIRTQVILNNGTSKNHGSDMNHAHKVHLILRANQASLELADTRFMHLLNAMFSHPFLAPKDSHPFNSPEYEAVSMTLAEFKRRVQDIRVRFDPM